MPLLPLRRSLSPSAVSSFFRRSMASSSEPITPSNTRIGWIGTGVMGRSMCGHLIRAGYSVTVFNRTISKAQALVDMGAKLADSPNAVASQSDVVFSIVGYPSDVRHVLLHPNSGALAGLRQGGVLVDMTTSEPSLAEEIAEAASSVECFSVDAPVSGGDLGAKNGKLAIFAGGYDTAVKRLEPLFSLMGKVNYMGSSGKGQYAKLSNQIVIASTMLGLVYAHKAGLDVNKFLEAIFHRSYGDRILKRDFDAGFYVKHFVKDLGICLNECQRMALALPGLALAQHLYLSLKPHGEGDLGTQALILALERLNNVSVLPVGA